MSVSLATNLTNGQYFHASESDLTVKESRTPNNDTRPDTTLPHNDEYTAILKKHLGVVESELSRLKGSSRR